MPEAGDLPTGNSIARQHGRQKQVDDVGLGGSKTARSGDDGNVVLVAEQQEITGLDGCEESFEAAADAIHGSADDIGWTGGRCRGGDQNSGRLCVQEVLEGTRD